MKAPLDYYQGSEDPSLTEEEMGNPGCGVGTEKACYALALGSEGFECLIFSNSEIAHAAGIQLGFRVNVDPADGKAWCPKGILQNSKKPPGLGG